MRVRVKANRDLSVPEGSTGLVIETDKKRSMVGYDTLVEWDEKLGERARRTWVPSKFLEYI